MAVQYSEIQELLRSRADLNARLNLMPYDGTPEIKERGDGKYLYVRKRVAGKQTSTYVGAYTEELYNLLLRNAREAREIRKLLRSNEKHKTNKNLPSAKYDVDVCDKAIELAKRQYDDAHGRQYGYGYGRRRTSHRLVIGR